MTLEHINCPTCEQDLARPFLLHGPSHLVQCRRCGLVYTNPRPVQGEVSAFFEEKYIPSEKKLARELGSYRAESLAREASLIKRMKAGGRILDIGCAGGNFLAHFPAENWERHGVEPSGLAAAEAARQGIVVYRGLLGQVEIPPGEGFDIITCLDTLCLSATPADDLRKMNSLLKPDGLLIIDLPGYLFRLVRNHGPLCWLINRRWTNFHPNSPHLFIFSTASLREMLGKTGLGVQAIHLEYAPARGTSLLRRLNRWHHLLAQWLFTLTGGRLNVAAKVVYVCQRI